VILDDLSQSSRYAALHPSFERAFEFLTRTDLASLAPGRHAIDGQRLYVSIDHAEGRGRERARLESHRRYIDIQVTIAGTEEIGWRSLATCSPISFDPERDVGFMPEAPESWFTLTPGLFAIFFPDDAHAPLAGQGPVRKAIVKVWADAR
jgi:biofilm protein TabA